MNNTNKKNVQVSCIICIQMCWWSVGTNGSSSPSWPSGFVWWSCLSHCQRKESTGLSITRKPANPPKPNVRTLYLHDMYNHSHARHCVSINCIQHCLWDGFKQVIWFLCILKHFINKLLSYGCAHFILWVMLMPAGINFIWKNTCSHNIWYLYLPTYWTRGMSLTTCLYGIKRCSIITPMMQVSFQTIIFSTVTAWILWSNRKFTVSNWHILIQFMITE